MDATGNILGKFLPCFSTFTASFSTPQVKITAIAAFALLCIYRRTTEDVYEICIPAGTGAETEKTIQISNNEFVRLRRVKNP